MTKNQRVVTSRYSEEDGKETPPLDILEKIRERLARCDSIEQCVEFAATGRDVAAQAKATGDDALHEAAIDLIASAERRAGQLELDPIFLRTKRAAAVMDMTPQNVIRLCNQGRLKWIEVTEGGRKAGRYVYVQSIHDLKIER